jgi:hypothetical protein
LVKKAYAQVEHLLGVPVEVNVWCVMVQGNILLDFFSLEIL